MASLMPDSLGSAIATQGVDSEPLHTHSQPIKHKTPLDDFNNDSNTLLRDASTTSLNNDDHDTDEDDLVMYEAKDILRSSPAQTNGEASELQSSPPKRHKRRTSSSSSAAHSPATSINTLNRLSLESVGFSYRDHILPLSLSKDEDEPDDAGSTVEYGEIEGQHSSASGLHFRSDNQGQVPRHRRRDERRIGLIDGIALTVGLQIGSGIFSSPGIVTFNTGSIGASLSVWLLSGILAWTGASSFAELGSAIPLNGGAQAYLNYSFGPMSGYLFSWSAIVCLKPSSAAIMATIFGEYLARIIYHTTSAASSDPHQQGLDGIPSWSIKLIAVLVVLTVTALNALSAKLGTRTQVAFTVLKLGALVAVPVLALLQSLKGMMPLESKEAFSSFGQMFAGSSTAPSSYALALYSGLWAFDGWDQSSYIAGEMKRVERDLPRVIHISLSIVVIVFLTTVASYFVVLAPKMVAQTNTVALDFGSAILGTTGGVIFAAVVAFSCFGALNGQFYTTARLVFAAGREGHLPSKFGKLNARTKTPLAALVLQAALVLLFILFGSGFASLVNFYGVCAWSFYFVTVLGLLYLRIKEPNLDRPYQTWLITPIAFSAVALFLLLMPIFSAPGEALAAFAFIIMGVPVYYATQASSRGRFSGSPAMETVLIFIRRCMGIKEDQEIGRGVGGSVLFGHRRVRRGGPRSNGRMGGPLESLNEEEEEGLEEEAVEMLPQQAEVEHHALHNDDKETNERG